MNIQTLFSGSFLRLGIFVAVFVLRLLLEQRLLYSHIFFNWIMYNIFAAWSRIQWLSCDENKNTIFLVYITGSSCSCTILWEINRSKSIKLLNSMFFMCLQEKWIEARASLVVFAPVPSCTRTTNNISHLFSYQKKKKKVSFKRCKWSRGMWRIIPSQCPV